ncbi:leucine-rich repeat protein, partial [bacterium]|nr:leucine-rich repeat protein [bacterium]
MKKILKLIMLFALVCIPVICLSSCTFSTAKYVVTYDAGEGEFSNGNSIVKQKIAKGEKLDASLIPSRPDYEFSYWLESGSHIEIDTYTVYKDITLTAVWKETGYEYLMYSQNFYSDSGYYIIVEKDVDFLNLEPELSCEENNTWEIENVEGKVVTNLQPGNNYFTILVFSEHKVRTQKYIINVHRKHNVEISYQVDGNEVFLDTILSGELYTPKDNVDILLPGYKASEWRREGKRETMFRPLEDTILETTPTPQEYTITYDGAGADYISYDTSSVYYTREFQLPSVTREGYTFKGWYYGEERVGGAYTMVRWNIPSDAILEARWEKLQVRLSLKTDNYAAGTVSSGGVFDYGTKVKVTATLNSGYTFLGWYKDTSSNEFLSNDLEYEVEVKGFNLIAKYQKFNLIATANYGEVILPDKGIVDKVIVLRPATESLLGFTFDGWYSKGVKVSSDLHYEFPMPKQSVTYEARWTNPELEIFNLDVTETSCKILSLKNGNQPKCLLIPDVVTEIGESAFSFNSTIYKVIIGDGVTKIGRLAFSNCSSLVEVVIGTNVSHMESPFHNCHKLVEIKNNSSCAVEDISVLHLYSTGTSNLHYNDEFIYYVDDSADLRYVMGYIGSKSILSLPEDIHGIEYEVYAHAFQDLEIVQEIIIPAKVSAIGESAFRGCINLEAIYYNATNIRAVAKDTFAKSSSTSISKKITVTIGKNVLSIPDNFLYGSGTLDVTVVNFEEESACTYIGSRSFSDLANLTIITIPKGIEFIGDGAYNYCSKVTKIEYYAVECEVGESSVFSSTGNMGSGITLYIGSGVTMIPDRFMYNFSSSRANLVNCVIESEVLTEIGASAFYGISSLKSFVLPATITKIGYQAFANCSGITQFEYNVAVLDKDNSIGTNLFTNMGSASGFDLTIGKEVTYIPNRLFYGSSLNSLTFAIDGVCTEIGESAFGKASKITSLVLPDSITTIHNASFAECTSLQELFIGRGIQTIGTGVFASCVALKNIYWNADNAEDGCVFTTIGTSVSDGTTITFGNDVKRIPGGLFSSAANLKTVQFNFNPSVVEIGANAFKDVVALTNVTIPRSVQSIEEGAFSGCTGLSNLIYQAEEVNDFTTSRAFQNAGILTGMTITFGNDVKRIPAYLFESTEEATATRISNVTFEKNSRCLEIGEYAFSLGRQLKNIVLPDSVESIGEGAFSNITELSEITIGLNTTTMGEDVFKNTKVQNMNWNAQQCQDFTLDTVCLQRVDTISFGQNVKRVPAYLAYENISSVFIAKFTNNEQCTSIGEYAFYKTKMSQISFPETLLKVEPYAFYGCSKLRSVILPDLVSEVGEYAFAQCIALTQVKLSDSMTIIQKGTFQGGDFSGSYAYVTLSKNLEEIGEYAFADNRNLKQIAFPSTLTKIGSYAFSGCSDLTTLTMPASMQQIGAYAFYRCLKLQNVVFENPGS